MTTDEMAVYIGERLLPCPFCGGEVTLFEYHARNDDYEYEPEHLRQYSHRCLAINTTVSGIEPDSDFERSWIAAWNTRTATNTKEDKA